MTTRSPPPDKHYHSKKRSIDAVNQSIVESNAKFSELATSFTAALNRGLAPERPEAKQPKNDFSDTVQSMVTAVGFALSKVQEDKQLSCLIDVLAVINDKYVNQ